VGYYVTHKGFAVSYAVSFGTAQYVIQFEKKMIAENAYIRVAPGVFLANTI